MALYLDSSALVKLVAVEKESDELEAYIGGREIVSSEIARTEVVRAVARRHAGLAEAAEDLLADIGLVVVNTVVTMAAAWIRPLTVRSLDALHVASARRLEGDLEALVTYDRRMIEAGQMAGLPVASPGASAA
jgi:predicted nucleic acid-binding protein